MVRASPPDGHKEDGCSVQIGWRIPSDLAYQVQECCRQEGLRPGQFLARAIRSYFGQPTEAEHVWSAKELEGRIRFPANISSGKWH